jgi:hypothetical protein
VQLRNSGAIETPQCEPGWRRHVAHGTLARFEPPVLPHRTKIDKPRLTRA